MRLLRKKSVDKIKAVFIDRDGTINIERKYVHKIEDFELIPGVLESLRLLTQKGIRIYIITNQAGIAKGYFTEEQFHVLTQYMVDYFEKDEIKIEEVLYCPHHPNGVVPEYSKHCLCRKPNIGLLEDIIERTGFKIDGIALIGDKNSDIDAGFRLGITTYLVLTGYGLEHQVNTNATFIKPDILSAVKHILWKR